MHYLHSLLHRFRQHGTGGLQHVLKLGGLLRETACTGAHGVESLHLIIRVCGQLSDLVLQVCLMLLLSELIEFLLVEVVPEQGCVLSQHMVDVAEFLLEVYSRRWVLYLRL